MRHDTPHYENVAAGGRIPSLDGLRAISISFVILGHVLATLTGDYRMVTDFVATKMRLAGLGVTVFFVLSGFLITTLLMQERKKKGQISLKHFVLRRLFRIQPPFYFFLLVMAVLTALSLTPLAWKDFLYPVFFMEDYQPAGSWWLHHSWSLGVEEKFYLLWPMLIAFTTWKGALRWAVALFCFTPVLRVALYFLVPSFRGHDSEMFHSRMDTLLAGCILALLWHRYEDKVVGFLKGKWWLALACSAFVLAGSPLAMHVLGGKYLLTAGLTADGVCVAFIVGYLIVGFDNPVGRLLNNRFIVHLGVLSFSLYLWQQFFINPYNASVLGSFPLNLITALVCAELSYRFVETPFLNLRKRFVDPRFARKNVQS